jgi:hypothetical protein
VAKKTGCSSCGAAGPELTKGLCIGCEDLTTDLITELLKDGDAPLSLSGLVAGLRAGLPELTEPAARSLVEEYLRDTVDAGQVEATSAGRYRISLHGRDGDGPADPAAAAEPDDHLAGVRAAIRTALDPAAVRHAYEVTLCVVGDACCEDQDGNQDGDQDA